MAVSEYICSERISCYVEGQEHIIAKSSAINMRMARRPVLIVAQEQRLLVWTSSSDKGRQENSASLDTWQGDMGWKICWQSCSPPAGHA